MKTKEEHRAERVTHLASQAALIADAASELAKNSGVPFKYAVQCAAAALVADRIWDIDLTLTGIKNVLEGRK